MYIGACTQYPASTPTLWQRQCECLANKKNAQICNTQDQSLGKDKSHGPMEAGERLNNTRENMPARRGLPRLLGRARRRLVLAPPSRAPRPCGTRPPGLGPAPRLLRRLRRAERPPRRLALAAHLPKRAHSPPDGVGGLPDVVGVEALLLQALPRVALQPPLRPVLPPRPLPRPLLARPELPQAAGSLLAQLQQGEGPAALCRRPSHRQGMQFQQMQYRPSVNTRV